MNLNQEKAILATIKCPRCGDTKVIKIPYDRFMENERGGLLKIAFNHGDHIFVAWLDSYGTQRATEVFDNIENMSRKHQKEAILLSDLIKFLGKNTLAKLLTCTTAGYKTYMRMDERSMKVVDFLLTFFLKEFPTIVYDKDEAEVILDPMLINNEKIPGEKYFLEVLDAIEGIKDRKIQYAKLQSAVDRVRDLVESLKEMLQERDSSISVLQIKKMLNINDNELLALIVNRLARRYPRIGEKIREKRYFLLSF